MRKHRTFCGEDAEAWRSLYSTYLTSKDAIRHELEHPPVAPGAKLTAMERGPDAQTRLRFQAQSVRSWATATFQSEAMRNLLADFAAHGGFAPDDAGGAAFAFLFLAVIQHTGNRVVQGGMGNLPAALGRCLAVNGGVIQTGTPVTQIIVNDGVATRVRLANGTLVHARCVVSNPHPYHLIMHLLSDAPLGPDMLDAVKRYEPGTSQWGSI